MTGNAQTIVPCNGVIRLVTEIFARSGCDADEAARIAEHLTSSSLAGHDSHGVIRVPRYVEMLRNGAVHAGRHIEILSQADNFALVDGQYGFGQTIGEEAVALGVEKAKSHGTAIIALRNAGHLGRIGDWAEIAAADNIVSLHLVNVAGSTLVAPFGARERRFSTNPIAIGIPVEGEPPVILDFATSLVAEGKALVAARGGKALPAGSLISAEGNLSNNPEDLYGPIDSQSRPDARKGGGALRAMGEHKGSGLSFICELLAGALTGSGCSGPGEKPIANGMLSIYLSVPFFASDNDFAATARDYISWIRQAKPAENGGNVLIPGDPERSTRAKRLADGVPFAEEAWSDIVQTAYSTGLSEAEVAALSSA